MSSRRVGFTGTRTGLKSAQYETLRRVLEGVTHFHHGCCVGADFSAWEIAREYGAWTVGHQPDNGSARARTHDDQQRQPLPYLQRNRAIVDSTDELVACPGMMHEEQRSGTWATIRHAKRTGKPVTIIWPDGSVAT
jgi:hypothetical protein